MLPCARRNVVEQIAKDGSTVSVYRCAHVDAKHFTQVVAESDCAGCVMRVPSNRITASPVVGGEKDFAEPTLLEDGTLVYPRTGWEPPKAPNGYERSTQDAWAFAPLWPKCTDRQMHARKMSCGCINFAAICGQNGKLVVLGDCEGCPIRCPVEQEGSEEEGR